MAKPLEACMFCEENPCTCNEPVTKKRTIKPKSLSRHAPVSEAHTEDTPVPSASEVEFSLETRTEKFKSQSHHDQRDLSFLSALRNLRDIVHPRDQRWIDTQLNPPLQQELDRRVAEWRSRNAR